MRRFEMSWAARFLPGVVLPCCVLFVAAALVAPAIAQESAEPAAGEHGDQHASGVSESEHANSDGSHAADAHAEEHDADHGGPHHDPTDLSHQNAGDQINDPSEFKSDLAIWTFVVFLGLLAVLAKFAWGPIVTGLDKREQGIEAKIEEAQRSADQAAKQLQQYEAKLAAATDEAKEIVAQARRDAEVAGERIVTEAQEVAARERQRAVEDIHAARNVAVQEITERSVELAVAMAGQLIRREVTVQDREQLIRDSLEQIPSRN